MDKDERICGCFNIKVEDVLKSKENGALSVDEVKKQTKFGKACGRCDKKATLTVQKILLNRMSIK